jgi:hypothetical protein
MPQKIIFAVCMRSRLLASALQRACDPIYRAIIVCVLLYTGAQAAEEPSSQACPGAASWYRSHPGSADHLKSNSGAASDPQLLEELSVRVERDQEARKKWLAAPKNEALAQSVDAIDAANLAWLRQLVSEKGFPTAAQVGYDGVHFAWVLLQHADQDPNLQSGLLPTMEKRFAVGELAANDLARITDRVLKAAGQPQRYGTQFDWFSGRFKLPDPRRLAEIDSERSRIGLMPLADYVCTIREERRKITQQ